MRKLHVTTFVSLDGVMQAPGGPEEDPTNEFTLGGWNVTYWDDVMGEAMSSIMSQRDEMLLGRKTYEIFAAHWPYITNDPIADSLNGMKKYVASRTLSEVTWSGASLLPGDAGDSVAALKRTSGPDLVVHGSGDLVQTLLRHDLVDVFHVWTFPLLLGRGKRLFGEGTMPGGLTLTDNRVSKTGVVIGTYERAGQVPLGSFQLAEPTEAERRRRANLT
jgi:dihydrofolate reductase